MRILLAASALGLWTVASTARAADAPSLSFGLRLQGWYVAEEHGAADGGTAQDFLLRRGYLSVTGKLTSSVSSFVHVSGDRIGQAGLNAPSVALVCPRTRSAWRSKPTPSASTRFSPR